MNMNDARSVAAGGTVGARAPNVMTPRIEHLAEGVTLYLGDCREILPMLGDVDAVVSDPPYGLNGSSGTINSGRAKSVYENATDTIEDVRTIYVPAIVQALAMAKR